MKCVYDDTFCSDRDFQMSFFTEYFLQKLMPVIKGALAFDGGSYRLCQVYKLGLDHEAQKSQPHGRRAGSERDRPSLLGADTTRWAKTKDGACVNNFNKALEKHPWSVDTSKAMKN